MTDPFETLLVKQDKKNEQFSVDFSLHEINNSLI
jgi:hypothetical protein